MTDETETYIDPSVPPAERAIPPPAPPAAEPDSELSVADDSEIPGAVGEVVDEEDPAFSEFIDDDMVPIPIGLVRKLGDIHCMDSGERRDIAREFRKAIEAYDNR